VLFVATAALVYSDEEASSGKTEQTIEQPMRGGEFSLSPRERAGVRGKGANRKTPHPIARTLPQII